MILLIYLVSVSFHGSVTELTALSTKTLNYMEMFSLASIKDQTAEIDFFFI